MMISQTDNPSQALIFATPGLVIPLILILLFVMVLGVFVTWLGLRKKKRFSGLVRLYADIEKIRLPTFEANISWLYRGIRYYSSFTGLHVISRRERVKIFLDPQSSRHYLNIWTHNGNGEVLGGIAISFLGLLAFILFLSFS